MNVIQSRHRQSKTERFLHELDPNLAKLASVPLDGAFSADALAETLRNLKRARLQFDSALFFVVLFGPVKAGKSTLTNALAGEYVSPTGFGRETTRRPSLIVRSAESGIDQYHLCDEVLGKDFKKAMAAENPQELSPESRSKIKAAFDLVVDHIRGLVSDNELLRGVRKHCTDLSDRSLKAYLEEEVHEEPLITVIRCSGGSFLRDGVALVDMPGLDGRISNWKCNPIHEWVVQEAEFFLFVQSSVAALNRDTHRFLQDVVKTGKRPPIWQVQNILDARHWRAPGERDQDALKQREEGNERLTEILAVKPHLSKGMNLGLAWDGRSLKREDWLRDSKFEDFEMELSSKLEQDRVSIHEANSLKGLELELDRARKQLGAPESPSAESVYGQIAARRKEHYDRMQAIMELKRKVEAIDYGAWSPEIKNALDTSALTQGWVDGVTNRFATLKTIFASKAKGQQVNEEVDRHLEALQDYQSFDKDDVVRMAGPVIRKYASAAEVELLRANDGPVRLSALGDGSSAPAPQAPMPETPDFGNMPRLQEKTAFVFSQKHAAHEIERHLKIIEDRVLELFKLHVDRWKGDIAHFIRDCCESRRRVWLDEIETAERDENQRMNTDEVAFAKTEAFARQLGILEAELRFPLKEAIASIPSR